MTAQVTTGTAGVFNILVNPLHVRKSIARLHGRRLVAELSCASPLDAATVAISSGIRDQQGVVRDPLNFQFAISALGFANWFRNGSESTRRAGFTCSGNCDASRSSSTTSHAAQTVSLAGKGITDLYPYLDNIDQAV